MAAAAPLAIGFLGAGQMATALAKGWFAAGLLDTARSLASDPYVGAREKFHSSTGVRSVASNAEVVQAADVLVLAVKPQTMNAVLDEVRSNLTDKHLVVSIAAGITLKHLAESLGTDTRLIRVMPNTPCLVGAARPASPPDRPRQRPMPISSPSSSTPSAKPSRYRNICWTP